MNLQVLVAAMGQKDYSLLDKMNIQSGVIVGNQCDYNSVDEFDYKGFSAKYLNFAEQGVGLNRNNSLMRATGDICLFADDDMVYVDGYDKIVLGAFEKIPEADVIIFNLIEENPSRYIIKEIKRVNYLNYLKYGTARIAVRLDSVKENGIFFNLCFGGGAKYCHGEDNLFLTECLNKGLKVYTYPEYIAYLDESRESTWNMGYNQKYLCDQGMLYKTISKKYWKLLCLQDAIRHREDYKNVGSWFDVYRVMKGLNKNKSD